MERPQNKFYFVVFSVLLPYPHIGLVWRTLLCFLHISWPDIIKLKPTTELSEIKSKLKKKSRVVVAARPLLSSIRRFFFSLIFLGFVSSIAKLTETPMRWYARARQMKLQSQQQTDVLQYILDEVRCVYSKMREREIPVLILIIHMLSRVRLGPTSRPLPPSM